jgi:hypothetical protein
MHEFHARERNGRRAKGLEGKHRRAATLDRSMVLLNDVVEIPATAHHDGPPLGILWGVGSEALLGSGRLSAQKQTFEEKKV